MTVNYRGREIRILSPIKRYVNAIERKLRLPWKLRARVMSDFATTLCARHEEGESYEEIMASLGTPKQVAEELNGQMKEYTFRRSPWRFVCLGAAALCALLLVLSLLPPEVGSPAAIGGADGPTAIFVTRNGADWTGRILCGLLLAAGLFGFFRLGRCKRGKSGD